MDVKDLNRMWGGLMASRVLLKPACLGDTVLMLACGK